MSQNNNSDDTKKHINIINESISIVELFINNVNIKKQYLGNIKDDTLLHRLNGVNNFFSSNQNKLIKILKLEYANLYGQENKFDLNRSIEYIMNLEYIDGVGKHSHSLNVFMENLNKVIKDEIEIIGLNNNSGRDINDIIKKNYKTILNLIEQKELKALIYLLRELKAIKKLIKEYYKKEIYIYRGIRDISLDRAREILLNGDYCYAERSLKQVGFDPYHGHQASGEINAHVLSATSLKRSARMYALHTYFTPDDYGDHNKIVRGVRVAFNQPLMIIKSYFPKKNNISKFKGKPKEVIDKMVSLRDNYSNLIVSLVYKAKVKRSQIDYRNTTSKASHFILFFGTGREIVVWNSITDIEEAEIYYKVPRYTENEVR